VVAARPRSDAELALALALPAYLLHGLIDIDWDFVAVSGLVFLVAGALAGRPPPAERARAPSLAVALAAAGIAVAVAASLFAVWLGDRWARQAGEALATPRRALDLAKRARSVNPLATDPVFVQALAEQELGRLGRAHGYYLEATEMQPENPQAWFALGQFELGLGCARHALVRFERFYELSPQDPGVAEKDKALKLVNSGTPRC
jgi:tetratricopeptide (TPR) repeat protein